MRTRALPAALCVLGCALMTPAAAGAATYASGSGFGDQTLVSGLFKPTAMAFLPDGTMFVAEKEGTVKRVAPGADVGTLALDIRGDVNHFSDRGLLGIAVDSAFPVHPYLYLLYTADIGSPPDGGERMVSHLTRFTLTPQGAVVPDSGEVIVGADGSPGNPCPIDEAEFDGELDCIPSDGDSHSIGTVRSAPDGTLFLGSGESASYSKVDPVAFRAGDERTLAGKVMHVDREGNGLPAADRPFCQDETNLRVACTRLFAKGFRNPFRFSLAEDGRVLVGDVGWGDYEELNVLPATGGGNYGWPCREGPLPTPGYSDLDRCDGAGPFVGPDYSYPHLGPTVGGALVAGPEYAGENYPEEFEGDVFIGDYVAGFLRRLVPNGNGGYVGVDLATDWRGVDLQALPGDGAGPGSWEGDMAYVDIANGQVTRVRYSPDNASPVLVATASPTFGPDPLTVQFDATGSSDPDGDDLTYEWDFEDDGVVDDTDPTAEHEYRTPDGDEPANSRARLTIRDEEGFSVTRSWLISPDNQAPELELVAPLDGATYRNGEEVKLKATLSDPEHQADPQSEANPGGVPAPRLYWDVRLIHGTHEHFDLITGGATRRPSSAFVPLTDHDADSHYRITATVTDARDVESEPVVVRVDPETVPLTLLSEPPGVSVSYGGRSLVTPFEGETAIGFETTVGVPEETELMDVPYAFESWSDGGAASHDLTVPAQPLTLTARFRDVSPPAPSPPAESRGPSLRFSAASGLSRDRRVLRGRASDPDGVKGVWLALARPVRATRAGASARRCRWVSRRGGRASARARSCSKPRWLRARLSPRGGDAVAWRLRFTRSLAPGRYRLRLRADDGKGVRSSALLGGARTVALRVPRPRN